MQLVILETANLEQLREYFIIIVMVLKQSRLHILIRQQLLPQQHIKFIHFKSREQLFILTDREMQHIVMEEVQIIYLQLQLWR